MFPRRLHFKALFEATFGFLYVIIVRIIFFLRSTYTMPFSSFSKIFMKIVRLVDKVNINLSKENKSCIKINFVLSYLYINQRLNKIASLQRTCSCLIIADIGEIVTISIWIWGMPFRRGDSRFYSIAQFSPCIKFLKLFYSIS